MGQMQLGSVSTEYINQYDKGLLFPIARLRIHVPHAHR
jgi:NADPH-dependent 7-cyano-7-deazaguanine reductase QueF-like protein